MGNKAKYIQELKTIFDTWHSSGDSSHLIEYLIGNSNLPGPRGNLELAWAFGDTVGTMSTEDSQELWNLCEGLASIPAEQAPVNDPREFLPFCGVMGLSALAIIDAQKFETTMSIMRQLARDTRWRMREAVCMGLQRLMAVRTEDVLRHLEIWSTNGDPLEMRAVAAAVADPPLLKNDAVKIEGLQLHRLIFHNLVASQYRKSDAFKALRKGLGYTLSVVVQANPEQGFPFMEELVGSKDKDVHWILKQNLRKNRLIKYFPEQVEHVKNLLE
jgi:hypothetical protein